MPAEQREGEERKYGKKYQEGKERKGIVEEESAGKKRKGKERNNIKAVRERKRKERNNGKEKKLERKRRKINGSGKKC